MRTKKEIEEKIQKLEKIDQPYAYHMIDALKWVLAKENYWS